jgi:ubiquinone/menaquinone biosynthesis C-methylase UbiE
MTLPHPQFPRLHIGCGRTILPGWINLDATALPGVDVVADLNACGNTPLPFADNSFDEFAASHVIEHITHSMPLMQELHRIAKPNATAFFRVPYGSSDDACEDPTHVRQYFLHSFEYFAQPAYWRADYGYRGDWNVERRIVRVSAQRYEGQTTDQILQEVQRYRNVVQEMIVHLRAVKPIREPRRDLHVLAPVEVQFV